MVTKRPYNVKLDPVLLAALRALKVRDGISESEQIRRGIRLWLHSKGVSLEGGPITRRAASRPRAVRRTAAPTRVRS